jgi:Flp pilus assembly pilin Flp
MSVTGRGFFRGQDGLDATEFCLLAAFTALAAVALLPVLPDSIQSLLEFVRKRLTGG